MDGGCATTRTDSAQSSIKTQLAVCEPLSLGAFLEAEPVRDERRSRNCVGAEKGITLFAALRVIALLSTLSGVALPIAMRLKAVATGLQQ
jgi:hypothetical protein